MANLSLRHIYKVYSNGCKAVNDFNMEIEDKEFIVFVGPSGCGKSTTLRMIAGLEEISAGELYIDDNLVNDVEPKDRDISMVFQNYALYPHMTVYDNMAFGLKLRHVPQEEIHQKVLWAAKVLKLTEYLDRKPRAMSGGQRQRVALGRAILRNPKVFLLDEPLSNLDAKLRTEMRAEITKLHQTLGTTFIYVTHDQVEAMTLGTRVVVMKLGYVQQIDTPQNLYNYPTNKFVAGFIGTPQMNFFEATLLRNGNNVAINFQNCDASFTVDFNNLIKVRPSYLKGDKKVTIGVRCENISIDPDVIAKSNNVIKVKVSHFEELGSETLIYGDLSMDGDGFEENNTRVIIKAANKGDIRSGDVIDAAFDMSKAHFFDIDTEESIAPRIPTEVVFDSYIKDGKVDFLGNKITLPPAMMTENVDDIELFVPTDAITFNGNIEAKVVNIENISKKQVIHLQIKDRIFFAVNDEQVSIGQTVNINIDIKRLSALKDGKEVIKALQTRNVFIGAYTNLQNNSKSVKTIETFYKDNAHKQVEILTSEKNIEIGKLGLNNILIKEYKKDFKKKKDDAQAELSLALGTLALGKDGRKKVKLECKEKIEAAKLELIEKIKSFRELKASVVESPELKEKAAEIEATYASKIDVINSLAFKRVQEYEAGKNASIAFLEMVKNEDDESCRQLLSELKEKFDLEIMELKECFIEKKIIYKRTNKEYLRQYRLLPKDNTEERTTFLLNSENILTQMQNELDEIKQRIAQVKEQYLVEKNNIISQPKSFFININGYYVKSDNIITKKIVQALGIGIFNVNYRYEIGLDSMEISNEGFEGTVENLLDYGESKYVLASAHDEQFVVKADKDYNVGDKILVKFDVKDIHVFENKLDIRLY